MPPSSPAPRLSAASALIAQESPAWICQCAVETPRSGMQESEIPGFREKAQKNHLGWVCCGVLMKLGSFWVSPLEQAGDPWWSSHARGCQTSAPCPAIHPPGAAADQRGGLCPPDFARSSCCSWDWLCRSLRGALKNQPQMIGVF